MPFKPLSAVTSPLAVVGDLDPTTGKFNSALPGILRLHCLLRGNLLVPEQFLLFNAGLMQMASSVPGRLELIDFLQHAPVVVSQHNRSQYSNCEDHLRRAAEEDHPFLIGVDQADAKVYSRFLDDVIVPARRVGIDTPAAVEAFPRKFEELAPHFGIAEVVTQRINDLAALASERPGRSESRLSYDKWNRNDLYLALKSSRFDKWVPYASGCISPDLLRQEPARSTILACARAAYMSALGDQLEYPDQDLLLPVPQTYDFYRTSLRVTKFESTLVRSLLASASQFRLPIGALTSCSWKTLTEYLESADPEMLVYFRARARFLKASQDEKLAYLDALVISLRSHLLRAGAVLGQRRSRRSDVLLKWHMSKDHAAHLRRIAVTFAATGLTHPLVSSWVIAAVGHAFIETAVDQLPTLLGRRSVANLASGMRASWYSAATVGDT